MTFALCFIVFLVGQRLLELVIAKRNTKNLLQRGAYEVAGGHYPIIVTVHTAWIVAIALLGWNNEIVYPALLAYAFLQGFRLWILLSLGTRWTTRIIVLNEPLIKQGPYKYLKHPNYVLVVFEIAIAPMVLGLWWVAIIFSVLNAGVLAIRIPAEERALKSINSH